MRSILHSDLNSYYASVEILLDPSLRRKALAVCGSRETRHGIVLAKSDPAKKMGVATGMAIWEAKQCCPDLLIVPPHYSEYMKYSKLVRSIYMRYTGFIEPFGLDECWLDVTGCKDVDAKDIAESLRQTTKKELGLTVSIGVSFNKVFAKLGSDMKKPDAITVIPAESFREIVWPRPVGELLGVGPATAKKLETRCIDTIGDLARCDPAYLKSWFGVHGLQIWQYANGLDTARVAPDGYSVPVKSVGHGLTASKDLESEEDVWALMWALFPRVSKKLRQCHMRATGIQVSLRSNDLVYHQFQRKLRHPTQSAREMAECARRLFHERYAWDHPVMALTVRAIQLVPEATGYQLDFFGEAEQHARQETLERTMDCIQETYGQKEFLQPACAFEKRFGGAENVEFNHMPGRMMMT